MNKLIIFTDGACSGNPGPGGWGAILVVPSIGQIQSIDIQEFGGSEPATTNNRMEMTAAIEVLKVAAKFQMPIDFYTDSVYVIRGITQWIWGWKKNNWKTAEGQEVSNKDLWIELSKIVSARSKENPIQWLYSRGHIGTPGNERCDEIAVAFSKNQFIPLYKGPIIKYHIPVLDLPLDTKIPEMKSSSSTPKTAFSYLSYLDGKIIRHKTWPNCDRRVKGRSGAKFKKTMSATEEQEVIKLWGLSGQEIIDE